MDGDCSIHDEQCEDQVVLPQKDHAFFMNEALKLAQQALDEGEIPVGAVVVANDRIIGKGFNQTERLKDSTAHAEMIAMTSAFQYLGAKYLQKCKLYVTLEPCVMCAGASHWAQVSELVYGADDELKGYAGFANSKQKGLLHPSTTVTKGVKAEESRALLDKFFKRVRGK